MHHDNPWSDYLGAATRDGLSTLSVLPTLDGPVVLKHVGGASALLAENDLMTGVLPFVDQRTGAVSTFPNVDVLVAAGWALD